ncbi:GNAT family N-acetyltransferase [Bacillus sp. NTK071]|uniref:GNAT family N-acetyltransferase n=1 Tax=Guptibacillus hwajinpoensis TaxID=208199 RepID=A0A4U1MDC8_9BACL|nr:MULTISPECIES: GNAT family N-acetyltransferase [Bacillaceae]MBN8210639.1 GNAT family N-acetyltransferase [Bacillus sp. NTK071]TKD68332.1 GNAT family N-acetyltransferase [Pseudalkalibacillus hwajinpoensis]
MIKHRDLSECHVLFDLMVDPAVFPFVRHKASSYEEYLFLTKQIIEAEEQGELISRTILDEWGTPIGTINLFDLDQQTGFLGTWIGTPYHGKGYNQLAKDAFFNEMFYDKQIQTIFMRINQDNIRSQKAAEKIPFVEKANEKWPEIFQKINNGEKAYHLYEIERDNYLLHTMRERSETVEVQLEA